MFIGRKLAVTTALVTALVGGIAPVQAMAAEDAADAAAVVTTVTNADGTVDQTIYTPAAGVSARDLAASLQASGASNVSVMAAACTRGTATTWPTSATCFVKWSYNGAVRPIIDFVDHTSASWPVGRAVTQWNTVSGIDSIYRPASSGCDGAPTHCVHVYSGNYGNNGWAGLTNRTTNAAGTYYSTAKVQLNDYYAGGETDRWASACHELGHVLGLNHNTSKNSCLYYAQASGVSKYPSADDKALIERFY